MSADGLGATAQGVTVLGDADHLCRHCRKVELTGQTTLNELHDANVRPELMAQDLQWEIGAEDRGDR